MFAIIYLEDGFFIKPKGIEFDPHNRVGSLLVDPESMERLSRSRSLRCRCFKDDRIYTNRDITLTSVDVRSGVGLFKYEDPLPFSLYGRLDRRLVLRIARRFDLLDFIRKLHTAILDEEMAAWYEEMPNAVKKAAGRFAEDYIRNVLKPLGSVERAIEIDHAIAFSLYEFIERV